jgi:Uma2 family endonuclease
MLKTALITFEEFEALPDPPGGHYELHHGELVTVTAPKLKHWRIQQNLRRLLEPFAEPGAGLGTEMGFRPLPEYEGWSADVGYLSAERFRDSDPEDNIRGAPDLVIEVLSPSNTAAEMLDKEQICVANGSQEFWVVDPERRRIRVTTREGRIMTYEAGQRVPVPFATEAWLQVDDVFRY